MKKGVFYFAAASTLILSAATAAWALIPLFHPTSQSSAPDAIPATSPAAEAIAPAPLAQRPPHAASETAPAQSSDFIPATNPSAEVTASHPATTPATTQADFTRSIDLTSTTFVTVHLKNAIFPDAATAVIRAAKMGININTSNEPQVALQEHRDFDVDHRPLVLAVMDLGDAYDIDISRNPATGAWELTKRLPTPASQPDSFEPAPLLLKPEHWAKAPVTVTGPFAVYARSLTTSRAFDPLPSDGASPAPATVQSLTMRLAVCCEPRITVAFRSRAPIFETCTDDRGHSLLTGTPPLVELATIPANPRDLLSVDTVLKLPSPGSIRLARVAGHFSLSVISRVARIGFMCPPQGATRSLVQPGLHMVVGGFADLMNGEEESTVELYRDGANDVQWQLRLQMMPRGAMPKIYDKEGRPLGVRGLIPERSVAGDRAVFHLRCFRKDMYGNPIAGLPDHCEWDIPLEMNQIHVPFAFDNLPLPSP